MCSCLTGLSSYWARCWWLASSRAAASHSIVARWAVAAGTDEARQCHSGQEQANARADGTLIFLWQRCAAFPSQVGIPMCVDDYGCVAHRYRPSASQEIGDRGEIHAKVLRADQRQRGFDLTPAGLPVLRGGLDRERAFLRYAFRVVCHFL